MTQTFADRFRPKILNDILGNHELVQTVQTLIDNDAPFSMILTGNPGTGKTTIAKIISKAFNENHQVKLFNTAYESKAELRALIDHSRSQIKAGKQPDCVIIDEIHRLDKAKQDFLLPALEHSEIIMIGTTTENPSLAINSAIMSRTMTFKVENPSTYDITNRLADAYAELQRDFKPVSLTQYQNLQKIASAANGDVRTAFNLFQLAYQLDHQLSDESVSQALSHQQTYQFDQNGNHHYQAMAALQKSIRGSDTDAALYYLAVVLSAGDLESVIRRLRVIAYEDIGLANMQLVTQVQVACDAALKAGLPEARIPLADAVISLALADKSNLGITSYDQAAKDAQQSNQYPIPEWINQEHPVDYKYPHNYPGHVVKQQYLPDGLADRHYLGDQLSKDLINDHSGVSSKINRRYNELNKQIGRR